MTVCYDARGGNIASYLLDAATAELFGNRRTAVTRVVGNTATKDTLKLVNKVVSELGCDIVRSTVPDLGYPSHPTFALLTRGDSVIRLAVYEVQTELTVGCHTAQEAQTLVSEIVQLIPKSAPIVDPAMVHFAVWRLIPGGGARNSVKELICPDWAGIRDNYPVSVRESIDDLVKIVSPETKGKIILWHGPPGTGKSYLVRALAREWSNRLGATTEVVMDFEALFGSADYMFNVLLDDTSGRNIREAAIQRRTGNPDAAVNITEPPLRLIIIEDGASLFSTGCRSSDAFSRLLNMADGIIGQGTRTVFLLTANEELGNGGIDPAVYRPGRCLQELEFPKFSLEEAGSWLADHGCDVRPDNEMTLSDLYAELNNTKHKSRTGCFGF